MNKVQTNEGGQSDGDLTEASLWLLRNISKRTRPLSGLRSMSTQRADQVGKTVSARSKFLAPRHRRAYLTTAVVFYLRGGTGSNKGSAAGRSSRWHKLWGPSSSRLHTDRTKQRHQRFLLQPWHRNQNRASSWVNWEQFATPVSSLNSPSSKQSFEMRAKKGG